MESVSIFWICAIFVYATIGIASCLFYWTQRERLDIKMRGPELAILTIFFNMVLAVTVMLQFIAVEETGKFSCYALFM